MDSNRKYPYDVNAVSDVKQTSSEHVSMRQLQRLVQLLDESDVSEIEIKKAEEGMHLVLRKAMAHDQSGTGEYLMPVQDTEHDETVAQAETRHTVTATLVGIFHTWAKPKGKALVSVGDRVKVGQMVGTIQSLNVISEVETTVAGRVVEILVQEGQAVEYGQRLMVIDSAEEA